jgi:colanic acid biosynthesis glycosyl transferase WcaI
MRLLLISQHFPPEPSNSAKLVEELVSDLAERHRVEVIAGRTAGHRVGSQAEREFGVRWITSIDPRDGSQVRRLLGQLWFIVCGVLLALRSPRPDVVVTMNDPPGVGVIGMVAALLLRRPLAVICHDVYPDITIALGRRDGGAVIGAWRMLNGVLYGRARSVIVVGRDMVEKLAGQGISRGKLDYIPAWASPQDASADEVRAVRRARGWDARFVVMFAGGMRSGHNLDLVPELAASLANDPEVLLVLVGDGPSKPAIVEEVERRQLANVEFVARLPKSDAQRLMAAADLHLVMLTPGMWGCGAPSKTYGIMAAGRPFVAAVDPGSESALIAQEFDCGLVVRPGSAAEIVSAIRSARSSALDEMGRRAVEAFEAHYQRATAVEAFERLFDGLAQRSGAPA